MNRKTMLGVTLAWFMSMGVPSLEASPKTVSPVKDTVKTVQDRVQWLIVVGREGDGKFYLSYFENGKRVIHTLASPWRPQKDGWVYTPAWEFTVLAKPWTRRSNKFDAVMPHAIHIHKGIYIHGWHVDGSLLSHGCIRVPRWTAKQLLKTVPLRTKVIIRDTLPRK